MIVSHFLSHSLSNQHRTSSLLAASKPARHPALALGRTFLNFLIKLVNGRVDLLASRLADLVNLLGGVGAELVGFLFS